MNFKNISYVFLLIIICTPLVFSDNIILDSAAIDSTAPNIAVDGRGNIAVIWSADTINSLYPQKIYHVYSYDGGSNFTFPSFYPFYGDSVWYRNVQPNVLYDKTGVLHFSWSLTNDIFGPVYSKSLNYGLSWRTKQNTFTLGYNVYPRNHGIGLAVSDDGQLVKVVWFNLDSVQSSDRVYVSSSIDAGTNWSTENITSQVVTLSVGYISSAVMNSYGNIYAISNKNNKINVIRCISGLWDSIDITGVNNNLSLANEHTIASDEIGNLYIVWGEDNKVYFSKSSDNGSTWVPKVIVDNRPSAIQKKPVIGLDTHKELIIAWQDSRDGSKNQIRWAESSDGGATWSNSAVVSPGLNDQNEPDMAVEGRKLHIVWIENGSPVYSSIGRHIDINGLGNVNLIDFGLLANSWGVTEGATWQMGDLNGDSSVDIDDLFILVKYWLESEIPAASHPPIYNNDNSFPNSTFDEFIGNLPAGWTF